MQPITARSVCYVYLSLFLNTHMFKHGTVCAWQKNWQWHFQSCIYNNCQAEKHSETNTAFHYTEQEWTFLIVLWYLKSRSCWWLGEMVLSRDSAASCCPLRGVNKGAIKRCKWPTKVVACYPSPDSTPPVTMVTSTYITPFLHVDKRMWLNYLLISSSKYSMWFVVSLSMCQLWRIR